MPRRAARLFWLSAAPARLDPGRLRPRPRAPAAGARPPRGRAPGRRRDSRRVSLIVAAYREEAVIAAKVANALALDWPRERLEVVVAVDGGAEPGADATAARARDAGADVVLELPRGGKVRAQDAAVARRTRRAAGVLGRQRAVGAGRAARAGRARSPTPRSATPAARCASSTRRAPTRRACTGATRCGCAPASRRSRRSPAGNGAIYAVRREAYVEVDAGDGPRPLVPVPHGQARAGAPSTCPRRGRPRRWCRRSRASGRASGG